jgi:hypothetical protein
VACCSIFDAYSSPDEGVRRSGLRKGKRQPVVAAVFLIVGSEFS